MSTGYNPPRMTVWDIIELALARQFRPPRDQQWLAAELRISPQAITQWKPPGMVPPKRYRQLAELLRLTVDQLEGLEQLPWDKGWPFPDIEPERFYQLTVTERDVVQGKLREAIEDIERARHAAQTGQGGLAAVKLAGETKAPQPHPKGLPVKRKKNGPKG